VDLPERLRGSREEVDIWRAFLSAEIKVIIDDEL